MACRAWVTRVKTRLISATVSGSRPGLGAAGQRLRWAGGPRCWCGGSPASFAADESGSSAIHPATRINIK